MVSRPVKGYGSPLTFGQSQFQMPFTSFWGALELTKNTRAVYEDGQTMRLHPESPGETS